MAVATDDVKTHCLGQGHWHIRILFRCVVLFVADIDYIDSFMFSEHRNMMEMDQAFELKIECVRV